MADDDPADLAVVIPVLNEAERLPGLLSSLSREGVRVVVADGGSTDGSRAISEARGAKVIDAPPGRGPQLNAGAAAAIEAGARTLLFLHADTRPPAGFPAIVAQTLAEPGTAAGAFRLKIDHGGRPYRWIEAAVNRRSRRRRLPYGDQGLFMAAETFRKAGGFPAWPAMEDYALVRRLRRLGRVRLADADAVTSPRGWERRGWLRATLLNQACVAAYRLGVSPHRIGRWRR